MTYYGVYSKKQFKISNNIKKDDNHRNAFPYIYYTVVNSNKKVQITEVFHDVDKKSLFDDAFYYGEVEYCGAYKEPQAFS